MATARPRAPRQSRRRRSCRAVGRVAGARATQSCHAADWAQLLAAAALVQWAALDGTRGSLALALLAAVGGPVAEIPLMAGPLAHAWHYLTPDYFPLAGVFPAAATPEAGLEVITGPCYFAVTTDAIALYRFYYEFSMGEEGRRGGCKKNLIK